MDDNFTEAEIQSTLTYLKYHDPENANRLFAIEFLRAFQAMADKLADKDLDQAELLRRTLEAKKKEKSEEDEGETEEVEGDDDTEAEESDESRTEEAEKP